MPLLLRDRGSPPQDIQAADRIGKKGRGVLVMVSPRAIIFVRMYLDHRQDGGKQTLKSGNRLCLPGKQAQLLGQGGARARPPRGAVPGNCPAPCARRGRGLVPNGGGRAFTISMDNVQSTYSQHTVNIQSTYSQHTVNIITKAW